MNENKNNIPKLMQYIESSAKREIYSYKCLCWKTRKNSGQQPNLQPRELEKEEQPEPKASRRKEVKIRAEINRLNRKTIEKIKLKLILWKDQQNRENTIWMWRQRSGWYDYKPWTAKDCRQIARNYNERHGTYSTSQPSKGTNHADNLTFCLWSVTLRLDTLANCNFFKNNQILMAYIPKSIIYLPDSAEQQICMEFMNNKGPYHEHCCQYLWEATTSPPWPSRNRNIHCNTQEGPRIILSWRPRSRAVSLPSPPSLKEMIRILESANHGLKSRNSGIRQTWIQIPTWLLTSY